MSIIATINTELHLYKKKTTSQVHQPWRNPVSESFPQSIITHTPKFHQVDYRTWRFTDLGWLYGSNGLLEEGDVEDFDGR